MENNYALHFVTFFYEFVDLSSLEYDGKTLRLNLKSNDAKLEFEHRIRSIFKFENLIGNKYELNLRKILVSDLFIFFGLDDYFIRYDFYKSSFENSAILILSTDSYLLKENGEEFSTEKAVIFNYMVYRELIDYLKSNPIFTTLVNETDNQIIILTKNNGAFYIGYKIKEYRLSELDNLQHVFTELKLHFEKKEFIQFFKEIIYNAGLYQKDINDRIFEIIKSLNLLVKLSEKDYENYVLEFSFEKIRTKFKEERNKYFESIDKNIDSLNKQVVSFPLTFAATAFASFQVKDKPLILLLIVLAYVLYSILAFKVLNISEYNIECLNGDISRERDSISNDYSKNFSEFKDDFDKIDDKIKKLNSLVKLLKWMLWSLLFMFCFYAIFQIFNKKVSEKNISIPLEDVRYIIIDSSINAKSTFKEKNRKQLNPLQKDSVYYFKTTKDSNLKTESRSNASFIKKPAMKNSKN